ncbi:hypothetical protein F5Y18DRAFT_394522 [Xylariaceae sp. FL1019]|nr:hypothetical protein F5Y18DRAFT_394522 [Xylariaceae sp. FL1019]
MQAPSGSRDVSEYGIDVLDSNIEFAQRPLQSIESPNMTSLPNRSIASSVFILAASIKLRDQVRRARTTPSLLAYLPADFRIYAMPQTI